MTEPTGNALGKCLTTVPDLAGSLGFVGTHSSQTAVSMPAAECMLATLHA